MLAAAALTCTFSLARDDDQSDCSNHLGSHLSNRIVSHGNAELKLRSADRIAVLAHVRTILQLNRRNRSQGLPKIPGETLCILMPFVDRCQCVRCKCVRCEDVRCEVVRCDDVRCGVVRCEFVRCDDVRCDGVRCEDVL